MGLYIHPTWDRGFLNLIWPCQVGQKCAGDRYFPGHFGCYDWTPAPKSMAENESYRSGQIAI